MLAARFPCRPDARKLRPRDTRPRGTPKTPRGAGLPAPRDSAHFGPLGRLELGHHEERDDERVDDERLDQREAENHRAADLVGGAGVAGDAVEGGGGGLALTETTTERGEAEADRGAEHHDA